MIVLIPILLVIGFLLVYEFVAMGTHQKLVTTYFREAFAAVPGVFMVAALLVGILFGHFFWN